MEQTLSSFSWLNSTRVTFGAGTLASLAAVVNDTVGSGARVFLVTGRSSLRAQGLLQPIVDSLGPDRVTLFDKVTPFPSPDLVDVALKECRAASADVVVAIGGGSPLDLAKAVAILMTHDGTAREYASGQKRIERAGLPFVAVPTTSGSSSEVTQFAAMWDMDAKRVFALGSPLMFPTAAIVDPNLTLSMPRSLAAAAGMDAFTSVFESYWSVNAQPIADALNLEVIRLFAANLERSCNEGDLESRSACALAATIAGIAYCNCVPNVCHAVGGPLTIFWGVEHGQAGCISLPAFLRWNADAISHKLPALWEALGVTGLDEATARITQIMESCGLETRLSNLGVGAADVDTVLEHMRWDRVGVLRRTLEREDARAIVEAMM